MQPARSVGRETALHQVLAVATAPRRGDPGTASPLDAQGAHHAQHLIPADPIPAPTSQLHEHLPVPVHGHEPVRTDQRDVTGQDLVTRPHPRAGTRLGLPVGARREQPAIQRGPGRPADRPHPEPDAMRVDIRDSISVVPGRARAYEKSRRRTRYLIRAAQLGILPARLPQLLGFAGIRRVRRIGAFLPTPQRLRGDTQALRHALQGLRLRHVIGARVRQQPHRPLPELRIISSGHDSTISSSRENQEQKPAHISKTCIKISMSTVPFCFIDDATSSTR